MSEQAIGVTKGGRNSKLHALVDKLCRPLGVASTGALSIVGPFVGGTLGYNWEFGAWVVGIQGDADWSRLRASAKCSILGSCETRVYRLNTIDGRFGYAFDCIMPYFVIGFAIDNMPWTTM